MREGGRASKSFRNLSRKLLVTWSITETNRTQSLLQQQSLPGQTHTFHSRKLWGCSSCSELGHKQEPVTQQQSWKAIFQCTLELEKTSSVLFSLRNEIFMKASRLQEGRAGESRSSWLEIADFNIACCCRDVGAHAWRRWGRAGDGSLKGFWFAFVFVLQREASLKVHLKCEPLSPPPSLCSPTLSSFSALCDVLIELFSLADNTRARFGDGYKAGAEGETAVGEMYSDDTRVRYSNEGDGDGCVCVGGLLMHKQPSGRGKDYRFGLCEVYMQLLCSQLVLFKGRWRHEDSSATMAFF